jgi:outer membrane receptor protein involved in Fe transport
MDPALFDLQRVEVLRGPQGTLYGASSMGGTVKYVTGQPDLTTSSGYVKSSVSDTDGAGPNYEVSGLYNDPLIPDMLGFRAIAFYRYQDGYINRYPIDPNNDLAALSGPESKDVNTERTYGMRLVFDIKPGNDFSIKPSFWYQRTELGAPFTIDDPPGSFDDLIQTRDVPEPITDQLELFSVTADESVQGVHLTSSTSYRNRQFNALEDDSKSVYYVFSPAPQSYVYPAGFYNHFANHDFTEEIRASAGVGRVHGLMGLFYLHQDNMSASNLPIPPGYNEAFGTPFGDETLYYGSDSNQVVQKAVFGELNIDLTQRLQATFGARVFDVTQSDHAVYTGVINGGPTNENAPSKDSGTNPKLELTYHLTPDILTYATAAKGFRQGGPLTNLPAAVCAADLKAIGLDTTPTSFKADTLWNYELGAKTAWLNNRLTVNAAIYYIDWTNLQQLIALPTCGFDFTGNFGSATSKGSELEIHYEPISALQLTLGTAYNEAVLRSTVAGAQGQAGDTLENAPRWTGSAAAEFHRQLGEATAGYARMDFSTTSHQYNNFDSTSIDYQRPGYSLADIRVGATRGAWDAALFVDNALNKHAETALPTSYALNLPNIARLSVNRPRTIGLDLKVNF